MKRALHIYASNGKNNSGDFMLGPSTRWHFSRNIIKEDIDWEIRDVRSPVNGADIDKFNSYDYIK